MYLQERVYIRDTCEYVDGTRFSCTQILALFNDYFTPVKPPSVLCLLYVVI